MKLRRMVRRRLRGDGGRSVVADVNAAVAANIGESGSTGTVASSVTRRERIVQRSRRKGNR